MASRDSRCNSTSRYLMPNEREACLLAGENDLDRAISVLRDLVPLLVIKRGSEGAAAFCGPQSWHVRAESAHFVDAVGAGDSFNAGFLHAWIRGWPIERALELGNRTGALSVAASGGTTAFRNATELLAQLAQGSPSHKLRTRDIDQDSTKARQAASGIAARGAASIGSPSILTHLASLALSSRNTNSELSGRSRWTRMPCCIKSFPVAS